MDRIRVFISVLLILALPISGFASVGMGECHKHANSSTSAAPHHPNPQSLLTASPHVSYHQAHDAGTTHHEGASGAGSDCQCQCPCIGLCALVCAAALGLPSHTSIDFDRISVLDAATVAQLRLPEAHLSTPYRPPILIVS